MVCVEFLSMVSSTSMGGTLEPPEAVVTFFELPSMFISFRNFLASSSPDVEGDLVAALLNAVAAVVE